MKKKQSLIIQLSLILAAMMLLLLSFFIFGSVITYRSLTQNTVNSLKSSMELYASQMDNDLQYVTTALEELSTGYINDNWRLCDGEEFEKYLDSLQMANVLTTKVNNLPAADCLFLAVPKQNICLTRYSVRMVGAQKPGMDQFLRTKPDFANDVIEKRWHLQKVDNAFYLFKVYIFGDTQIGAIIRLDTMMIALRNTETYANAAFQLRSTNGEVAYSYGTMAKKSPFSIERRLENTDVSLMGYWPYDSVYANDRIGGDVLLLLAMLAVMVIGVCILYLRRRVLNPLKIMMIANSSLEGGNLDYRIEAKAKSAEFQTLFRSFNSMTQEIRTLKIQAYEDKLREQKAHLKYLQMQIRPHFYLNAITTISSLAYQGRNEEIQKFINGLSVYLRYNFTDYNTRVTVEQEIKHAADYINLQQIRYPGNIFFMTEISPKAATVPVPTFLVQTFVENIFKHAFKYGKLLSIFISAEEYEEEGKPYIRIRIDDNGEGFGPYIEAFQNGIKDKQHVGIRNIRRTLSLQYGKDDLVRLGSCQPHGARVEILIPLDDKHDEGGAYARSDSG